MNKEIQHLHLSKSKKILLDIGLEQEMNLLEESSLKEQIHLQSEIVESPFYIQ